MQISSVDTEHGRGELARLIDVATAGGGPENLLDRLPADGEAGFENLLSDSTLASVVEAARFLRDATETERLGAPALAGRLERHPETRARMLVANHARYQTWGLAEELMARSRGAVFGGDAPRGLRLARLATSVADHLDPALYGAGLIADLRARAWGNLGNAYRCASQLQAAAAALRRADDLLLDGTGDPLEAANLLSLRASLSSTLWDLGQAEELLDQALETYEELGETQLMAKVLVKKAGLFGYPDAEEALAFAVKAEELIDPEEDARLFFMARHNRILWLIEAGRPAEAGRLLSASRSLYGRFDDAWTSMLLGWAEARVALGLEQVDQAEAYFRGLLDRLLEGGHQLDAACCALELSACRLALGDTRGASELAATMAHHLRAWGAHNRAREAWALLQHYLSLETASQELLRDLSAYLRRAWRNPRLAFRPRLD